MIEPGLSTCKAQTAYLSDVMASEDPTLLSCCPRRFGSPKRKRFGAVLLSALLICCPVIYAHPQAAEQPGDASDVDCAKAISTPDLAICSQHALEAADEDLNKAYRGTMASIDKTDVPDDARVQWRKALVDAQRRWITFRDAECELTGFEWYGGTGRSGAFLDCLTKLTRERIIQLDLHANPR